MKVTIAGKGFGTITGTVLFGTPRQQRFNRGPIRQ